MPENINEQKKKSSLSGLEKAAVVILSLPPNVAAKVLKQLKDYEIEKLTKVMLTVGDLTKDEVNQILEDALEEAKKIAPLKAAPQYIKQILSQILPPEKLEELMKISLRAEEKKIFEELEKMDSKLLANLLKHEHPQIIAIILSQLSPQKAAEILQYMPKRVGVTDVRKEVIKRLSRLEKLSLNTLKMVAETLEEEISGLGAGQEEMIKGLDLAAEIINNLPKEIEQEILEDIRKENPSLAEAIEDRMFKFEDIVKLDQRAIMEILKNVDKNDLLLACKGAPKEIIDKFLSAMSKRAAQMFLEDLEALGPVKRKDVEKARRKIIQVIKKLAEEGKIDIKGGEEAIE
ncbi:MAG TPA: flagellar motor switch protein FliG [Desulfurobacteriaceae bacterium]|nr:flagellar motor switch protein FliG [Desulfurobacteriaceae bacterium]